jgi:hypothetical protein
MISSGIEPAPQLLRYRVPPLYKKLLKFTIWNIFMYGGKKEIGRRFRL